MWRFLDYVTEDGSVPIFDWYDQLSPAEQAEFDSAIDYMHRIDDWASVGKSAKKYRELTRELKGLVELKFALTTQEKGKNLRKQFRPVGIMKPESLEFILLGGFQKGQDGPIPEDAYEKILKHKKSFESNKGAVREHKT